MRGDRETAGESAVTFGILDDLVGGAPYSRSSGWAATARARDQFSGRGKSLSGCSGMVKRTVSQSRENGRGGVRVGRRRCRCHASLNDK